MKFFNRMYRSSLWWVGIMLCDTLLRGRHPEVRPHAKPIPKRGLTFQTLQICCYDSQKTYLLLNLSIHANNFFIINMAEIKTLLKRNRLHDYCIT